MINFFKNNFIHIIIYLTIIWILTEFKFSIVYYYDTTISERISIFVNAIALMATLLGIISFKIEWAKKQEAKKKYYDALLNGEEKIENIFIDRANEDKIQVLKIKNCLKHANDFNDDSLSSEYLYEALKTRLIDSEAIILIYSNTKYLWVKKRYELYKRIEVKHDVKIISKLVILTNHKEKIEKLTENKVKIVDLGSSQWKTELKSAIDAYLKM